MARSFLLKELAERLNARLIGDPERVVRGLGSLERATEDQVSHFSNPAYRGHLAGSRAAAVILKAEDQGDWQGNALVVSDPYLAFARVSQLFVPEPALPEGTDPDARIAADAVIDERARIGPGAVIGARTRLGAGVQIHANAVVGPDCEIGAGTVLYPNAVVYQEVRIGERCVIHAGAVLGADGFGFAPDARGELHAIAQLGGLVIGNDVSVGAGTTIDRGAIDDTVIEDGVKIDNQVQIGHNCRVGAHSVICGCVGLVGSTRIGRHCVLAGGVGVGGSAPISICDRVTVTGMTHVSGSISEPGIYSGGVIHSRSRSWKRNALRLKHLDALFRRVAELERRLGRKPRE
jgi:UDP-3-O-[3-hydroxymyristoyl] glucosamine N-acyltransferase